jgi:hypothetical protein
MTTVKPDTSSLLDAKEKTYQSRNEGIRRAISFKDINAQAGHSADAELLAYATGSGGGEGV